MSMTFDEVAELLAFCAVHDKRKGDELDINAWLLVANDHGWTKDTALRVAREHYGQGEGRPRLEAPAITDRIRAIRKRAAETFELPRIPADLPDHEYPAWLRRQRDAHCDDLVWRWGMGGEEPPVAIPSAPRPDPIGQRRMAEITAGAFRTVPVAALDASPAEPVEAAADRRAALARLCPYCEARPGHPCTRSGATGRVRIAHPHPARLDNAQEAS